MENNPDDKESRDPVPLSEAVEELRQDLEERRQETPLDSARRRLISLENDRVHGQDVDLEALTEAREEVIRLQDEAREIENQTRTEEGGS